MADFCPLSSASSNSVESDNSAAQVVPNVIVSRRQYGQLWKKIGIVGSVAVMGGQPVLAQIDAAAGDMAAVPVAKEAEPFLAVNAATPETAALAAPPPVVSPEAAAPSFSNAAVPTALEQVANITAQVEVEIVPPAAEVTAPTVENVVAATEDTEATAPETVPETAPEAVSESMPEGTPGEATAASIPDADATPELDVVTPGVEIVRPSDIVPEAIPTVEELAAEHGGVFVDPTEYSEGETLDPDAPEVVVSERSTGCEYTVGAENNGCGESEAAATTVAGAPRAIIPETAINIGPVSISRSGVRFSGGATSVAGREFYNTVARPLVDLQAGESFVFPLASPSPITSLFGWRWHPIHHDYRFHSGTDVGAPQGTPILATQSGQVSVADYLGGYGLTVILRHNENTLESRYAHMSHMLVQPGEWVEQGDVIGLVGSTGNSTGPHLHFELHQLTGQGWVAISPNEVLSYALANLNNRLSGNPLRALNIIPQAQASSAQAALPKAVKSETVVKDAPHFRPAQPHAQ